MINKLFFEGRVGKDPVLKYTPNNTPNCVFSVCQTVKSGNKEIEQWIEVTAWGRMAESYAKNLHAGRRVIIDGKNFYNHQWIDRDGKTRTTARCEAVDVGYLDQPTRRGIGGDNEKHVTANASASNKFHQAKFDEDNPDLLDIDDTDVPFGR